MTIKINRRKLLGGASSTLVLASGCTAVGQSYQDGSQSLFVHGVASGDPDQTSIVLWTRISGQSIPVTGRWEVALDGGFKKLVKVGEFTTSRDRDYTVKVVADKLNPSAQYFYRFLVGGYTSLPGRTRTLPIGHVESIGIALASCSNYPFGYFNAYEAIANDPKVEVVLHLGDYIYEYGPYSYGGESGKKLNRNHFPARETVTLEDYRQRHAQYKAELSSIAMHASHPLIAIWDDHESANNPWMGGAQNHQPEKEGDWKKRKMVSLQAYYEWMPVREPEAGGSRAQYWRHFKFGDLASLVTLETRHTGRDLQIDYAKHLPDLTDQASRENFVNTVLGAPDRKMLSSDMETYLQQALKESKLQNRTWRLLGNQIPMARTHVPPLEHPYFSRQANDKSNPVADELSWLKKLGEVDLPIYLDTWDGYPVARERLYEQCRQSGVQDLLVLTGDSHSFWANALFDKSGCSMGLELGTSGITSPGDFVSFDLEGAELMDQLLADHNKEIVWTNGRNNGYVRLRLDHHKAVVDYISVSDIKSRDYTAKTLRSFNIVRSEQGQLNFQGN